MIELNLFSYWRISSLTNTNPTNTAMVIPTTDATSVSLVGIANKRNLSFIRYLDNKNLIFLVLRIS